SSWTLAIDGKNLYEVFNFGSATVNLIHLRITRGRDDDGGGIHMTGTNLTLKSVTMSSNSTNFNGGAIQVTSGTLYAYDSTFSSNSAEGGGAIFLSGGSAIISGSTFLTNTGTLGGAIGGVGVSSLHVNASAFEDNSATYWGGALYLQ